MQPAIAKSVFIFSNPGKQGALKHLEQLRLKYIILEVLFVGKPFTIGVLEVIVVDMYLLLHHQLQNQWLLYTVFPY